MQNCISYEVMNNKNIYTWIIFHLYLNTSRVTCCFAITRQVFSYIRTLLMPIPQKMAKAWTKFSSFFVNGKPSNLLTSWNSPSTRFGLLQCIIGIHNIVLCLKSDFSSTLKLDYTSQWYLLILERISTARYNLFLVYLRIKSIIFICV